MVDEFTVILFYFLTRRPQYAPQQNVNLMAKNQNIVTPMMYLFWRRDVPSRPMLILKRQSIWCFTEHVDAMDGPASWRGAPPVRRKGEASRGGPVLQRVGGRLRRGTARRFLAWRSARRETGNSGGETRRGGRIIDCNAVEGKGTAVPHSLYVEARYTITTITKTPDAAPVHFY